MKRIVAVALAVLLGANALAMLAAPLWWYAALPGVRATGPFNPHFVLDIGATYLVVAGALAWFAWRATQGWAALVAATGFLVLHAVIHVAAAIAGPTCGHDLVRDLPGVFLPALACLWLAAGPIPQPRSET
jgi:hypothetical protein